jgi:hypothetical protein
VILEVNGSTRSRSTAYAGRSGGTAASREPSTTSTATSARRTDRGRRRARGGLRLAGSWAEIGRPPGNRARREGGCSLHTRGYPVSIPHDIENRGVATGIDWELNPHVRGLFPPPPQVTELARVNLSRWRHGFEPRWDYEEQCSVRSGFSTCPSGFTSGASIECARRAAPASRTPHRTRDTGNCCRASTACARRAAPASRTPLRRPDM